MKIGIIGRLAEGTNLLDGQTIKTRVLKQELESIYPDCEIDCIDTYNIKKKIVGVFGATKYLLKECDCVFVLLSKNGRSIFFPLLYHLNKKYKKPIYHDVIGGTLADEAQKKKNWKQILNSFTVNWVELPSLQQRLAEIGVNNAETLPNFKRLPICEREELPDKYEEPYKFCTFSRVIETKGITTAAQAIRYVNQHAKKKIAELYVYGEIDPSYEDAFGELLQSQKDEVFYGGKIPFDRSVEKIKPFFMLLFPSTHPGEGFPGTFIDAYSAGVPIIASDWKYNAELVEHGVTGLIYDVDKKEQFYELVWYAISSPEEIVKMKENCLNEAEKYRPEYVMEIIKRQIHKDGCM